MEVLTENEENASSKSFTSSSSKLRERVDSASSSEELFQEAGFSWLENHWNRMKSPVAVTNSVGKRIFAKRRRSTTGQPHDRIINSVPLAQIIEEESEKRDYYSVSLKSALGLGIDWKIERDTARVTVHAFSSLIEDKTGECYIVGPAEACGLVQTNDELIRINDVILSRMEVFKIRDILQQIDSLAKVCLVWN